MMRKSDKVKDLEYIRHNGSPERFVYIPVTESYVSISKTTGPDGEIITNLTGYDEIRMTQRLGLYLVSSSEWDKSRKHFEDDPDKEFAGRAGASGTGAYIEKGYKSHKFERTSTLLAFRKDSGDFAEDVHDLLKEAGFDGRIALIDFPYVQEDSDIFIPSPRMRIVDVSGEMPSESGYYIQFYNEDLGIRTEAGDESNPDYHRAYFWVVPESTRQIIRGYWRWPPREDGWSDFVAHWRPAGSDSRLASRLSSIDEPTEKEEMERARRGD